MSGPLVSATQLAEELRSAMPPCVLDVRWKLGGPAGIELYRAGHIPGAAYVDLDADLAAPPGPGGRHPLPAPEEFAAAMRRSGVSAERGVVVYDADDSTSAARCWWLLRHHGHPDVRVLDGGLRAWLTAGQPLEPGEARVAPGDFSPGGAGGGSLDADAAAAIARSGVLLDARAAERYRGEVEPVDTVAGHIPGARSAPTAANLDPDSARFLPAARLAERFAALGVESGTPVAAYCGSGITAAHEVLALELAGISAGLYAGSWSNWIAAGDRPVATGPDPG